MLRIIPNNCLEDYPCSIVAVSCALGDTPIDSPEVKQDGYATLQSANAYIRRNLPVKKRINYKRGERPNLKDLNADYEAIVCVFGHFLYLDRDKYYSFFDNDNDDVVSVWILNR